MDIKVQQQMWLVLLQGINKDKRPTKEEMMKTQEDSPSTEGLTKNRTDTNHDEVYVVFLINQEKLCLEMIPTQLKFDFTLGFN